MGTNRGQIRVCRQNRDVTAMGNQSIEDGALDAEIDGDNAEGRVAAALQR